MAKTARPKAPGRAAPPSPLVGGADEPLSAYPGWDAEEGVFRLDGSLSELEERYRRIAEQAAAEDEQPAPGTDAVQPALPPRS